MATTLISSYFNPFLVQQRDPASSSLSPVGRLNSLSELTDVLESNQLTFDQWVEQKREVEDLILSQANDMAAIDSFYSSFMNWGLERSPEKTMQFLTDVIHLDTFIALAKYKNPDFENVAEWAAIQKVFGKNPLEKGISKKIYVEWRKCRPMVIYFIPNLINIFLGAFDFLDPQKKFTTLWDKYLVLEIVYKFFVIPYCLVQLLQPILVVTSRVYVVAALSIMGLGILIACYQRWIRPLPNEIINCANLDKSMEYGYLDPKVGQAEDLNKLMSALLSETNVLLIGNSGEGKTSLMHHYIQLKEENKLPPRLQELHNFEIDCGLMLSHLSYGHSELINQTKEQVMGYENKVLFFLDEFYQLASEPSAYKAFKKRFLEDKPRPLFIATITIEEFDKMKELDLSRTFWRRITPLKVDSSSEKQNRLILSELIERTAADVPIADDAIDSVLELSKSDSYLAGVGRAARSIKILSEAIGRCRLTYNPHFTTKELSQAMNDEQQLLLLSAHQIKPDSDTLQKYRNLRQTINQLETDLTKDKEQIKYISEIIAKEQSIKDDYYGLAYSLSDQKTQAEASSAQQKLFLLYHFYGIDAIKTILQNEIDKISSHLSVQVTGDLIRDVYDDLKDVEEKIYGPAPGALHPDENDELIFPIDLNGNEDGDIDDSQVEEVHAFAVNNEVKLDEEGDDDVES